MKIKSFIGGFDKNFSYLIWCEKTKIAAIIDPAVDPTPIQEYIESKDLILSKILITHTHNDHIAFLNDFLYLFPNLLVYCYSKPINISNKYIGLIDGEIITIGESLLTAIYSPGHFGDSMCFWNKKNKCLFTGDTMFVGRTGRVVSHTSSIEELYDSIYNKILTLGEHTLIYPGHNYGYIPFISIKKSIDLFNFFQCKDISEFKKVMQNFEKNR
tara:strand:+ start:2225 stop:2866 length:642 start_codon:yes stop_codon:yes gene_type:complete